VAESIAEVNGRTDFPLNESTEFEFVLSNLGPVDAEHVPIDFPVTFIDNSGRYSNIMASYVVQNIPAQRRSRAGFNITFQKPALCQMKLRIDKDGTINEISRKNNEVASEWYSIDNFKPNPPTGGDPEPDGEQKLIFPFKNNMSQQVIKVMHLHMNMDTLTGLIMELICMQMGIRMYMQVDMERLWISKNLIV